MRQYKYKAKFEAKARCLIDPERGQFLAKASLADLKGILPADASNYPDLLPIAGNACVINLGNGNGDMVDTEVGMSLVPQFVHKFINLEHDRGIMVGHLTTSAATKFNANYAIGSGSDIIDVDSLKDSLEPFNIAVGGYIYKAAFPDIARQIEESNDPDSPKWLTIAFSWELAFDEHKLFVGSAERGGKGEIISDPEKIKAWASYLRSNKGSGKAPDGRPIYRLISWAKQEDGQIDPESVIAMGVALTLAPAGAVAGVVTPELPDSTEAKASQQENSSEIISQSKAANVTSNTINTMKVLKDLNDLKTLNDENVKEYSFANIQHIVEAGMQKQLEAKITEHSAEWVEKINSEKNAAAAAKKQTDEALAKVAELEKKVSDSAASLAEVKAAQEKAVATQKYNERMSHFDEKFELDDATRKVIAKRIQGLDDDAFASVAKDELEVLLASKDKGFIAKQKAAKEDAKDGGKDDADENKDGSKKTAKASQEGDEAAKAAAAEALKNAKPTAAASVPNTTQAGQSLKDKYAAAFSVGKGKGIEIKTK